MRTRLRSRVALAGALALVAACSADSASRGETSPADAVMAEVSSSADASAASFTTVARVLRHPRCLNCHPSGDRPAIKDDGRQHPQNVQRGADGHGVPGMRCATCHRDKNQDLVGVPGAPHWHLAPRSMGWVGLDDHQLAESLKDRAKNGDRSLDDIVHHMEHDPLVGWAWDPGAGRSAPPISRAEFVAAVKAWVEAGAVSPAPGTTSY